MNKRREHRSSARVTLARLAVEIPNSSSVEPEVAVVPARSGDISTGGVGFVLPAGHRNLRQGERLTVRFTLPDSFDELLVRAEVRHVERDDGGAQRVGAAFLDADELVHNPLYRYIEEALLALRATSESFIDGFRI